MVNSHHRDDDAETENMRRPAHDDVRLSATAQSHGEPLFSAGRRGVEQTTKRRKWPWIVAAGVALFVIIGVANGGGSETPPTAAPAPTESTRTSTPEEFRAQLDKEEAEFNGTSRPKPVPGVLYEVTGSGRALVTYGSNGGASQENNARLPWKKNVSKGGPFSGYTVNAARSSGGSGEVTCRITVDGEVIAEQTSNGPYAVAACVGTGGF